jgi:tetratricopeptide (TPR) repeat protein
VPASTVRSILPQMRLKPDDPLTLEVARDLCERTASQAVLHGHLVRTGNRYLITEEATNCVDGATLGTAKQQVQSGDDLPGALDRIGAALRHDLGESRRTIARFNQPLLHQVTGSLEALEDFSQANYVGLSGRYAEAVELLKKAVALDPQFAAAYINLYVYSQDALDTANANLYLQKAYDLREFTTQPTRFAIVAYYDGAISGDLNESLRNDQLWINLYPRSTVAWNALANVLVDLGRYPEAVEAARRHLEMQPNFPGSYLTLASDQMQAGDFAGSRKTCDLALSRGFDQDQVHTVLLDLGHLTHDADLIAAQERWGDAHPDSTNLLAEEVAFAIQEGRFTRARQLADRLDAAYRSLGADVSAVTRRQNAARAYFELGEPAFAHQQLHLAAVSSDAENQVVALAEDGQIDAASAMLAKQLADCPKSTSWTERYGPELNAEFALLRHDPARAVLAMASAGEVDINVFFVHGEAYREAGQFGLAETEFRSVLARAPTNPTSWQVPQAQLMLARTLASEGKKREAIEAYNAFFAMWSHADPNASLLLRARSEYASIQAQSN